MVALLLFTSVAFYTYSKDIVLEAQREADRKVLTQIRHNLRYIEQIVMNTAVMVNLDPGIVYLMNANVPEPVMKFQTLRKLDTVVEASAFIDSIVVVSGVGSSMFFGGFGLWTRTHMVELQDLLRERLASIRPEEIGKLVPVRLDRQQSGVDVFLFILVGNRPEDGALPSAVVVNVRPQWIFENVSSVNSISMTNENMLLVDRNGAILYSGGSGTLPQEDLGKYISQSAGKDVEFSVSRIGDRDYVVSEMSVGLSEWRIMNLVPYDEVMSRVHRMRNLAIMITSVFLIAGFLLSLIIANRLYRPIRKLVDLLRNQDAKTPVPLEERDEMSFLTDAYRSTLSKLEQANRAELRNKRIVEDYYLRIWVTDSASRSDEEFTQCMGTCPGLFEGGEAGRWRLAVLAMDHPAEASSHEASNGYREKLYRFAACNIAEETLSRSHAVRVIDMNNEFIVAIIRSAQGSVDEDAVLRQIGEAQAAFRQYYRRTFSAAVSGEIDRRTKLTEAYEAAIQLLMYRLAFGPGALIAPQLVAENQSRDEAAIPAALEKNLADGLKAKDEDRVRGSLRSLFEWIGGLHYDYMTFGVQQVLLAVRQALRDPALAAHASTVEWRKLNRKVMQAESLAAMRSEIEAYLIQLCSAAADPQKEDRNRLIVDAIKEIIEKNFSDITLSLQSIASMLKMSPAYVGRIFRQYERESVGDYLTGYRLEKARELLRDSDYTVKEIADFLGFSNPSYFITLFKKKYGATPKEYRTNMMLGR